MKSEEYITHDTADETKRCSRTKVVISDEVAILNHEHEFDLDVNDSEAADEIATNLNLQRDSGKAP